LNACDKDRSGHPDLEKFYLIRQISLKMQSHL
jgi:hypothetical protein